MKKLCVAFARITASGTIKGNDLLGISLKMFKEFDKIVELSYNKLDGVNFKLAPVTKPGYL